MPTQLHHPSPVLDISALDARDELELARLVALWAGGHRTYREREALTAAACCVEALNERSPVFQPFLDTWPENLRRLADLFPGGLCSAEADDPSRPTLWECLAALDINLIEESVLAVIGARLIVSLEGEQKCERRDARLIYRLAVARGDSAIRAAGTAILLSMSALIPLALKGGSRVSREGAAATFLERQIENRWRLHASFLDPRTLSGMTGPHGLTSEEVIDAASKQAELAREGDPMALVLCVALWLGIRCPEAQWVELFAPLGTGLLRLGEDCRFVEADLSFVFHHLAKRKGGEVKASGLKFRRPLPLWLADVLAALRAAYPGARTLAEVLGLRAREWPRTVKGVSSRVTVSKLLESRARPLIDHSRFNQLTVAVALLQFRLAEKSSFHYQSLATEETDEVLEEWSRQLRWGPLAGRSSGPNVLSAVTPTRSAVTRLVDARIAAVNASRPGPNAGWALLERHFNQLMRYQHLMCTVGWHLRGRLECHLPASIASLGRVAGWPEKQRLGASEIGSMAACGQLMARQLSALQATASSMLRRAGRLKERGVGISPKVLAFLRGVADADHNLHLFQVIEHGELVYVAAHELAADLDIQWQQVPDALRHFGPDEHRQAGSPAWTIEALLRHDTAQIDLLQVHSGATWEEWASLAGREQDRLLADLGFKVVGGLVSERAKARP